MLGVKAALKAAKSALDAQDYAEAATQANIAILSDPQNYFGNVFLGRALEKQDKLFPAIDAYKSATKIKPGDELAWKGLCNTYRSLGSNGVDGHTQAALGLAGVYADKNDKHQGQTVVDGLVSFAKENGSRQEYKRALETYLPSGPVYDWLEGRIPTPALIYTRLAEITEAEERERINKEIGERRTRLGAKVGQVTLEVTREVFAKSDLEVLYEDIINWSSDDEARRTYEEKLLQRAYDHLVALSLEEKGSKRAQVTKLAHDMVVIKHPYKLAWHLELEWNDVEDLVTLDKNVLDEYIGFFPQSGLSKVLQGYFGIVPMSEKDTTGEKTAEEHAGQVETRLSKPKPMSTEDRLLLLVDGLDDSKDSVFAHRVASDFYLQMEEHESCAETCRTGRTLLKAESDKSGLGFQNLCDALNANLATSLVYYQSPKNHPEARDLFNDILQRRPESTAALLGIGLIFEEEEQYDKATNFLDRALSRDPENLRIGTEAAWCKVLNGDLTNGLPQLEDYLGQILADRTSPSELKAQTSYRVGKCLWDLDTDRTSRRSRDGAYKRFIAALKANPNYAPPYTSLGIYYADYARDRKRARQCFQKAFELSASEVLAAERLARDFANDREWDVVEIIAQRVINSGVAKPSPGSKRKGISWPFAALGVVQMDKQEYGKAVISFQAALRISPNDYNSWIGLGESYHSSGRYIAAQRALEHAQTFKGADADMEETWFAQYMLANVFRELGDYEKALSNYQHVLNGRSEEFGVAIAFLATLVEQSRYNMETGFYGRAAQNAARALVFAEKLSKEHSRAFNLWKAVGDTCSIFSSIPGHKALFETTVVQSLFLSAELNMNDALKDLDVVTIGDITGIPRDRGDQLSYASSPTLSCAILAFKQAIHISSSDIHAQSVAWYNLGLAEWSMYSSLTLKTVENIQASASKFATAAVRCFKRAIELEARNADFWNALGVVTTHLNPKVAQHSFVRSLHLNERSARTWTNLGTLYLLENDHELAHNAFARAQSTDPDYTNAWVGEGLIALLMGDVREALSHFTHAVEIADASCVFVRSRYVISSFDQLLSSALASNQFADLVQPIFALQQLQTQVSDATAFRHLLGLLHERVANHAAAMENLLLVCEAKEAQYEETEDPTCLGQFAKAKGDLARNQLAAGNYEEAAGSAETVLDLTAEQDPAVLEALERQKSRLSAHLTAGLARYNLGDFDQSLEMFKVALEESGSAPDVVCLLSQVLWAKGGEAESGVAKDQLFDCVEKHPNHIGATTLLGAMSALDGDDSTLDAVMADLQAMRTSEKLEPPQKRWIAGLLAKLASLTTAEGDNELAALGEATSIIMIMPSEPLGWLALAQLTSDTYAADMALKTAMTEVAPKGTMDAEGLSRMFAGTGSAADAQRSIFLYPSCRSGWESLQACAA